MPFRGGPGVKLPWIRHPQAPPSTNAAERSCAAVSQANGFGFTLRIIVKTARQDLCRKIDGLEVALI